MKPARFVSSAELAKAFDQNVKVLESRVERFLESSDPPNTQALRKATRRLRMLCSVLPKKVRKSPRVRRYLDASRRLAKTTGKVRDLDTIATLTSNVTDIRDRNVFASDLEELRRSALDVAVADAKRLKRTKKPSLEEDDLPQSEVDSRGAKVERRLSRKIDSEFEEFLVTQEVDVMHALRKDSKRLRHLLEYMGDRRSRAFLLRLRSIQDDLGRIRDHDLVIDYLQGRARLMSTRSLVREEIAKRHAKLEEFMTKNRGQGHLVPATR